MSRCILTIACGEKYRSQSETMLSSFLGHNDGWAVERFYDDAIELPSIFKNDIVTPFNRCEIGRWTAMRKLLDKYDEVLYCDNDVLWYDEYRPLNASIVLSPHYITDKSKYSARNNLFWFGVYNIGLVYLKGREGQKECDFVIDNFLTRPRHFYMSPAFWRIEGSHATEIWLQGLAGFACTIGLDFAEDKDAGLNVAYWNIEAGDRSVFKRDGRFFVSCNGKEYPLRMFHFSNKIEQLERYDGVLKELYDDFKARNGI